MSSALGNPQQTAPWPQEAACCPGPLSSWKMLGGATAGPHLPLACSGRGLRSGVPAWKGTTEKAKTPRSCHRCQGHCLPAGNAEHMHCPVPGGEASVWPVQGSVGATLELDWAAFVTLTLKGLSLCPLSSLFLSLKHVQPTDTQQS